MSPLCHMGINALKEESMSLCNWALQHWQWNCIWWFTWQQQFIFTELGKQGRNEQFSSIGGLLTLSSSPASSIRRYHLPKLNDNSHTLFRPLSRSLLYDTHTFSSLSPPNWIIIQSASGHHDQPNTNTLLHQLIYITLAFIICLSSLGHSSFILILNH